MIINDFIQAIESCLLSYLQLKEGVIFNANIIPVEMISDRLVTGQECSVTGWHRDKNDLLKISPVTVQSREKCKSEDGSELLSGMACVGYKTFDDCTGKAANFTSCFSCASVVVPCVYIYFFNL